MNLPVDVETESENGDSASQEISIEVKNWSDRPTVNEWNDFGAEVIL